MKKSEHLFPAGSHHLVDLPRAAMGASQTLPVLHLLNHFGIGSTTKRWLPFRKHFPHEDTCSQLETTHSLVAFHRYHMSQMARSTFMLSGFTRLQRVCTVHTDTSLVGVKGAQSETRHNLDKEGWNIQPVSLCLAQRSTIRKCSLKETLPNIPCISVSD